MHLFVLLGFFLVSLSQPVSVWAKLEYAPKPLFNMMDQEVLVFSGDVPKWDQKKHHSEEMATERSQPYSDPTVPTGLHFKLKEPIAQKSFAIQTGMAKIFGGQKSTLPKESEVTNKSYLKIIEKNPALLDLLQIHRSRYTWGAMRKEDGPSLVNSDYEYYGISDREFGYCWGYATLNRYFSHLAFFDSQPPTSLPAYVVNGGARNEIWFRFYQTKIDLILSGKVAVIPGFADFRAFTLVPEVEFYIKLKAIQLWADRAVRFASLNTFFSSTTPMENNEITALLLDIQTRVARGELPKLLFTAKNSHTFMGGTVDVHAVLALGVEKLSDSSARILIWDINFYAEDYLREPKYIEVRIVKTRSGKNRYELHYQPWWENFDDNLKTYESSQLGEVRIAPENDLEMKSIVLSLNQFCSQPKNASRYCYRR